MVVELPRGIRRRAIRMEHMNKALLATLLFWLKAVVEQERPSVIRCRLALFEQAQSFRAGEGEGLPSVEFDSFSFTIKAGITTGTSRAE